MYAHQKPIAALYVETGGVYYDLAGVDPWDEQRDARKYRGPHPVVAHPPCERWGRFWQGGIRREQRTKKLGDDGGCFAAALAAVRKYGGVIEHPAFSHAWAAHDLTRPPTYGEWVPADWLYGYDGWTCYVEQGAYGHPARKPTWLYAHGVDLPDLRWGRAPGEFDWITVMYHSAEERQQRLEDGTSKVAVPKIWRSRTPEQFRDVLIGMARSAHEMARVA